MQVTRAGGLDNLLMRFADIIYAFPDLLFFIIVMTALRDTPIGQALNGLILLVCRAVDRQLGRPGPPGARPGAVAASGRSSSRPHA